LATKTPEGSSAKTSSAVAVGGTTITSQPASDSRRRILYFTPESNATTR
jgi:hypothetical protein